MQLDNYAPCPCGSGKKLKFCCSKDMLHDLEKVVRVLDGEQFVAALDQATKLIAERGPRPALLALQAEAQFTLKQFEAAEQTANKLLGVLPHSPIALGILTICDLQANRLNDGIQRLQQALENIDEFSHPMLAGAIMMTARALLDQGEVLAARGHLLLLLSLTRGQLRESVEAFNELNRIPDLPVLLKEDFQLSECPDGVPWRGEFLAAMKSANYGAWLVACESLDSLDQKIPNQPAIVRNRAILRTWLGDSKQARGIWRAYSLLPGVSEDAAVDAEALSQLLADPDPKEMIDFVQVTYTVREGDQVFERCHGEKRLQPLPVDLAGIVEEGTPPPKGAFRILDREMPTYHEGMSYRDLPRLLGFVAYFGKQTDREARLVLHAYRSRQFHEVTSLLAEIFGDLLDPNPTEEVVSNVEEIDFEMNAEIIYPPGVPKDRAIEFNVAARNHNLQSVFPELKRASFDGKSAREAVQIPELRRRVQGSLLNLELSVNEFITKTPFDMDLVRRDLGLPERGTYRIRGQEVMQVPISQWGRVDVASLTDDELKQATTIVTNKQLRLATRQCAHEILARPSIHTAVDLQQVYRVLCGVSVDTAEALKYMDSGRRSAVSSGRSPAQWYLLELQLRLSRMEAEESNRLIKLLATRHRDEPGISESLHQLLVRNGIISPDGQIMGKGPDSERGAAEPAPAAASQAPEIWTPQSAAPKQESKLWIPGMP